MSDGAGEILKLRSEFKVFDKNGDDTIDAAELEEVIRRAGKGGKPHAENPMRATLPRSPRYFGS